MPSKGVLDTATLFGLICGFGSLMLSMVMEFNELNPNLGSAFLKVSALLIIFGGTIGCTMTSFPMAVCTRFTTLMRIALFGPKIDHNAMINTIVKMAELARREGVLALESKLEDISKDYPFLVMGSKYVIDGRSADALKGILMDNVSAMEERHKEGVALFNAMGGYAPTMGIVGTVIGLIGALSKAGEGGGDPNAVVEAIATAFIATFYGIASANLFFLPIASKLQNRTQEEVFFKFLQIEALLAIQAGENPRGIREMLFTNFRKEENED